ncbi:hypothetical protein ACFL59_06495, partial [Planctomycetota bacterium]
MKRRSPIHLALLGLVLVLGAAAAWWLIPGGRVLSPARSPKPPGRTVEPALETVDRPDLSPAATEEASARAPAASL